MRSPSGDQAGLTWRSRPDVSFLHARAVRLGDGDLEARPDERDLAAVRGPGRRRHVGLRERREDGDVGEAPLLRAAEHS